MGRVVVTPDALRAVAAAGSSVAELLRRHWAGDAGDRAGTGAWEHEQSLSDHYGPLSAFTTRLGEHLLAITDPDTGTTTLLLAQEYAARTPAIFQELETVPLEEDA